MHASNIENHQLYSSFLTLFRTETNATSYIITNMGSRTAPKPYYILKMYPTSLNLGFVSKNNRLEYLLDLESGRWTYNNQDLSEIETTDKVKKLHRIALEIEKGDAEVFEVADSTAPKSASAPQRDDAAERLKDYLSSQNLNIKTLTPDEIEKISAGIGVAPVHIQNLVLQVQQQKGQSPTIELLRQSGEGQGKKVTVASSASKGVIGQLLRALTPQWMVQRTVDKHMAKAEKAEGSKKQDHIEKALKYAIERGKGDVSITDTGITVGKTVKVSQKEISIGKGTINQTLPTYESWESFLADSTPYHEGTKNTLEKPFHLLSRNLEHATKLLIDARDNGKLESFEHLLNQAFFNGIISGDQYIDLIDSVFPEEPTRSDTVKEKPVQVAQKTKSEKLAEVTHLISEKHQKELGEKHASGELSDKDFLTKFNALSNASISSAISRVVRKNEGDGSKRMVAFFDAMRLASEFVDGPQLDSIIKDFILEFDYKPDISKEDLKELYNSDSPIKRAIDSEVLTRLTENDGDLSKAIDNLEEKPTEALEKLQQYREMKSPTPEDKNNLETNKAVQSLVTTLAQNLPDSVIDKLTGGDMPTPIRARNLMIRLGRANPALKLLSNLNHDFRVNLENAKIDIENVKRFPTDPLSYIDQKLIAEMEVWGKHEAPGNLIQGYLAEKNIPQELRPHLESAILGNLSQKHKVKNKIRILANKMMDFVSWNPQSKTSQLTEITGKKIKEHQLDLDLTSKPLQEVFIKLGQKMDSWTKDSGKPIDQYLIELKVNSVLRPHLKEAVIEILSEPTRDIEKKTPIASSTPSYSFDLKNIRATLSDFLIGEGNIQDLKSFARDMKNFETLMAKRGNYSNSFSEMVRDLNELVAEFEK